MSEQDANYTEPLKRSTEIPENDEGLAIHRCRSCRAEIVWAETLAGRRIPLDADASRAGNVVVQNRGNGRYIAETFSGRNLETMRLRMDDGIVTLYMPHHATCPDAKEWRS